jgi:uncharacterized protein (TIGR02145 family)
MTNKSIIFKAVQLIFLTFIACGCSIFQKSQKVEIPPELLDTIHDSRDGQTYLAVKIEGNWWMAENLNTGKMTDNNEQTDNDQIEKYCYKNDSMNCVKYGGMYQWDELMAYNGTNDTSQVQGICPEGWHIPTDHEWMDMEYSIGMNLDVRDDIGRRGINQGDRLKTMEKCTKEVYCNMTGFSAKLGGMRDEKGYFYGIGFTGNFWTATDKNKNKTWYRQLLSSSPQIVRETANKSIGLYVRCVKNRK